MKNKKDIKKRRLYTVPENVVKILQDAGGGNASKGLRTVAKFWASNVKSDQG